VDKVETITIYSDYDIIFARMRTREIARQVGFNTADQARISLAASSLAQKLDLGLRLRGQLSIEHINVDGRSGVRLVFTVPDDARQSPALKTLEQSRWMYMVDDLQVKSLAPNQTQVIAVKWSS
jgi:hypothetical protein